METNQVTLYVDIKQIKHLVLLLCGAFLSYLFLKTNRG